MKLLLVRHGTTQWGLEHRTAGRTDIPLAAALEHQALELGSRLVGLGIESIVASPLVRARRTAELINRHLETPLVFDERLVEFGYGTWEGLTHDEIQTRYPGALKTYLNSPLDFVAEGGESVRALGARVEGFLTELSHAPGTVLVVGHAMNLRVLRTLAEGRELSELWTTPALGNLEVVDLGTR